MTAEPDSLAGMDEDSALPQFRVQFTRTITYTSIVRARSSTDAGVLVGGIIRADEPSRAPRQIHHDGNAVEVDDEGLGEMRVMRIREPEAQP